jgi:hypothetical protein
MIRIVNVTDNRMDYFPDFSSNSLWIIRENERVGRCPAEVGMQAVYVKELCPTSSES